MVKHKSSTRTKTPVRKRVITPAPVLSTGIALTTTADLIRKCIGDIVFMQGGEMQLLRPVPWRQARIGERFQLQDLVQVRAALELEYSYIVNSSDATDALIYMAVSHEDPRKKGLS